MKKNKYRVVGLKDRLNLFYRVNEIYLKSKENVITFTGIKEIEQVKLREERCKNKNKSVDNNQLVVAHYLDGRKEINTLEYFEKKGYDTKKHIPQICKHHDGKVSKNYRHYTASVTGEYGNKYNLSNEEYNKTCATFTWATDTDIQEYYNKQKAININVNINIYVF